MALATRGKVSPISMLIFGFFFLIIGVSSIYNVQKSNFVDFGNVETENSVLIKCDISDISNYYGEYKVTFTYEFNNVELKRYYYRRISKC